MWSIVGHVFLKETELTDAGRWLCVGRDCLNRDSRTTSTVIGGKRTFHSSVHLDVLSWCSREMSKKIKILFTTRSLLSVYCRKNTPQGKCLEHFNNFLNIYLNSPGVPLWTSSGRNPLFQTQGLWPSAMLSTKVTYKGFAWHMFCDFFYGLHKNHLQWTLMWSHCHLVERCHHCRSQ